MVGGDVGEVKSGNVEKDKVFRRGYVLRKFAS